MCIKYEQLKYNERQIIAKDFKVLLHVQYATLVDEDGVHFSRYPFTVLDTILIYG